MTEVEMETRQYSCTVHPQQVLGTPLRAECGAAPSHPDKVLRIVVYKGAQGSFLDPVLFGRP
jgi:hypothetical protein